MDRKALAEDTLRIIDRGKYVASVSKREVDVRDAIDAAVRGTITYAPGSIVPRDPTPRGFGGATPIVNQTTASAGRRLALVENVERVCVLNFASAKKPGGGFLGGAKAQEEDLARASALYACLAPQRAYYEANRRHASNLYTDHVIYSPGVPFFRDDRGELLEEPAMLSVITAPAPNAGAIDASDRPHLRDALVRRAGIVLEIAARHAHTTLVLGAWGCGVFRNDARDVANTFRDHLASRFATAFDRVVFAVWDTTPERATFETFREVFST